MPEGKSGWEFSVDEDPGRKADHDYRARPKTVSAEERAACTFVFVTPRNWKGKTQWGRAREVAGDWKAVRALDASDLEQWLETTIAPRIWLAGELGILSGFEPGSPRDFETVDQFWNRWAAASDPPMTPAIFAPSVAVHAKPFKTWLETARPNGPFTVTADSREEAVAFVACLLQQEDTPAGAHDRAVVFESASALRILARSSSPFIPIVHNEEVERELAVLYRQRHCIVARPRNAVDRRPDVAVELLSHAAFEQAVTDMGIEPERVDRLARMSGRSPTVLRRRLSQIPAIERPSWAEDERVARRLMPMALVGAWHAGSRTDCAVLEALAGRAYERVEEDVAELLRHDDCPIWRVGRYRGVVSRIDALFAVGPRVTEIDLARFLNVATCVLSESIPPSWRILIGRLHARRSTGMRQGRSSSVARAATRTHCAAASARLWSAYRFMARLCSGALWEWLLPTASPNSSRACFRHSRKTSCANTPTSFQGSPRLRRTDSSRCWKQTWVGRSRCFNASCGRQRPVHSCSP